MFGMATALFGAPKGLVFVCRGSLHVKWMAHVAPATPAHPQALLQLGMHSFDLSVTRSAKDNTAMFWSTAQLCGASRLALLAATERAPGAYRPRAVIYLARWSAAVGQRVGIATGKDIAALEGLARSG